MIKNLRKISEEEMLRNWALAEVASVRRQKYLGDVLSPEILRKVQEERYEFSGREWQKLVEIIKSFRAPLLDGLLSLKAEWLEGELTIEELKELEIMNWLPFVNLAGSRKLVDLVQAFQQGKMPPNHHEFAESLEKIKRNFDLVSMKGKPIIVSHSKKSPYMLIEGFTRLSAMLMNILEGQSYEREIPIILGVSERLNEWNFV